MTVLTLDQLNHRLDKIARMNFDDALAQCCLVVEREAKKNCPVDTGELRRSIQSNVDDHIGTVGTNLEYAPYVEFGTGIYAVNNDGRKDVPWRYMDDKGEWHTTSGQKAQPFLYPALENSREKIDKYILKAIQEALRND